MSEEYDESCDNDKQFLCLNQKLYPYWTTWYEAYRNQVDSLIIDILSGVVYDPEEVLG